MIKGGYSDASKSNFWKLFVEPPQTFFLFLFVSSPSYTSKVPEQRLDESNVGHQMLKKMGEFNSLVKQCDLRAIVVRVT